ncbi:two-component system, response regulator AauR [Cupriavidus metallidurans]|jgi:two-component system C4-dicarboxylate transport response regulator DctD|uniref:Response regulator of C4-dicarboxylate transport system n=1 Tax=Cupriavidus metallidurans (strain ATCC 43123 / DSM 2839 / NBRC 102507 / CH34) TaxID=266264 RepID=Q1LQV2_CUPMC|nr:sigma-54 dependent transcriptional regulator [Cupriavidus metallidurans]ABF07474.1 response regulator of C4-dicarboxylate transport system [Cupriavidus metallidurans CH34]AVA32718.1 sigma-54-dependent Fis family transcriptional regulator [Cupriavidus metallidurans]MDE4916885.1 sigma-54 dependent transcriptional regulator [Cupriavidus metallidurans]QGS28199.1 response regulator [Cupriavidus metallidurans]
MSANPIEAPLDAEATSPVLTVLIVEDDADVRLGCEQALRLEGIATRAVGSAEAALREVDAGYAGIVVSDINLPGSDGMALLRELASRDAALPVIMITGHGDITLAVQAMKQGAYDFIEKPFSPERLVATCRRALEKRRLALEVADLRARLAGQESLSARLIGHSPAIERLRQMITGLGNTTASVLIHGETGTGKELVARCLHEASARRARHFVPINCGGLPEQLFESEIFGHEAGAFTGAAKRRIGKIEHAEGGTLFLDEIESMPMQMQIKLLRVLQERVVERLGSNQAVQVNARVVAATKADLRAAADVGQFRADLYYRLNVVTLELPPLRERREDIPLLFEHFVAQAALRFEREAIPPTPAEMAGLMAYPWPGNVRELRNLAERHVLGLGCRPGEGGHDMAPPAALPLAQAVEQFERALIADALRRHDGNLTRAGESLGIAKTTLFDKVRKYGLSS